MAKSEADFGPDPAFEFNLQRMFAVTPVYADAAAFAARVEARLNQSWAMRRAAIGVAGLVGGLFAIMQLIGTNIVGRMDLASRASVLSAERGVGDLFGGFAALAPALKALPLGGETLWLIAGMALLAAGLLATRVIEDL